MNKLKRILFAFAFTFCLLSVNPLTVHATSGTPTEETVDDGGDSDTNDVNNKSEEDLYWGTGDAIADIMNDERFEGAIGSISAITGFVDIWFTRIITFVAFFIISAAMLKNVCAGAYCANSKFWDKVAEAHQKSEAVTLAGMKDVFKNVGNTSVGGLRDALLGIVPNIKAWTDFDDADIEPKAYFMKAIPQMIGCVIIGIFIYNGYYRDTAATVGSMGSEIIERTLGSVNPESFINKIFNTTGWPDWPTEHDPSKQGQFEYEICKEIQSLVASEYSDVDTTEEKSQFVATTAQHIRGITTNHFSSFYDPSGEDVSYDLVSLKGVATSGGMYTDAVSLEEADAAGNVNWRIVIENAPTTLGCTTAKGHVGNNCFVITGTFKYKAEKSGKGASSVVTGGWQGDDAEYNFNILTPTVSASAASDGKVLVVGNINVDQYIGTEGRPENFNPSLLNLDNNPQGVTMKNGVVSLNVNLTASDKVFIGTLKYNHSPIGELYVSPSITGN